MDASTSVECAEITATFGSSKLLADKTGSRAYERFTGPQIKHIHKHQPEVYAQTERISLISSFLATVLTGHYAPIDLSDGSGMNLLDIHTKQWDQNLLDLVAPGLREKLGEPVPAHTKVGSIASYWCEKYGLSRECVVICASGDNPCSLIGLDLIRPGMVAISLGTSDVLFAVTAEPKPSSDEGSILIHPQDPDNYMMMLVYKNGAMTRQHVRDAVHDNDKDWSKFSRSIESTPVGSNGRIGFYFVEKEITPNVKHSGIVRFDENHRVVDDCRIDETDCRAIIESQAMSYKHHAKLLGLDQASSIVVTGGGSTNKQILQIIADVFEMDVYRSSTANTAASGAAIRALRSTVPTGTAPSITKSGLAVKPIRDHFPIYRRLLSHYARLEPLAVEILNKKK
jgi:xylulokinase